MADPFIGEIRMFGFNFNPRGWAFCAGQLLPISQNTALFSLIGTYYGGNGQTTFGLPDLRGRVGISMGQGPGLPNYNIGQAGGTETVTLTQNQMPQHSHPMAANNGSGTASRPSGGVLANSGASQYAAAPDGTIMNPASIGLSGGNQPFSIIQPYLTINFCIALSGIFPSRN
jgi:microcystin-dependent protein